MIDQRNSTVAPLAGGGTWTGTTSAVGDLNGASIVVKADVAGTLYVETSTDGTTFEISKDYDVRAGESREIYATLTGEYYRVRYVNGATIQTAFALETKLLFARQATAVSRVDSSQLIRPASNYCVGVAAGEIDGVGSNHKFGYNKAAAATVDSDIWTGPTALYTGFLLTTAATKLRIKVGGNAADDAAGTHARSVVLMGLSPTGEEISEEVATAGASASLPTVLDFWRFNRGFVKDSGAYGNGNKAAITIETDTGIVVGYIDITTGTVTRGQSQTQMAIWTVPAGKIAICEKFTAHVEGTKTADLYFWQRQNADAIAAPFTAPRIWHIEPASIGEVGDSFRSPPPPFPALTDIWVSGIAGAGGAKIAATFDVKILDA